MAGRRLTRLIRRYAPRQIKDQWDRRIASSFAKKLSRPGSLDDKIAFATGGHSIRSNQQFAEIHRLLCRLTEAKPKTVLEIGSDLGGTLALFAQCARPDALIVSLDLNHEASSAFGNLAVKLQRVIPISGDSHCAIALDYVKQALNGQSLDFLFIDGDHSFDGVRRDFEMYGPLLREGGLLAFHDIVDDGNTCDEHGVCVNDTGAYAGGVPEFFNEYVKPCFETESAIQDDNQHGYGIGMLNWPDKETARQKISSILHQVSLRNAASAAA